MKLRYIACVLFLSWLAAAIGVGASVQRFITPRSSEGQLRAIAGDGWVENGARIQFKELATRFNRIRLEFDSWRPAGMAPASVVISVCGVPRASLQITPENATQSLSLSGDCEPREISFQVKNPFVPSEKDQRQVGMKLKSLHVYSLLGFPLVALSMLLKVMGAIAVLTLLFASALGSWGEFSPAFEALRERATAKLGSPLNAMLRKLFSPRVFAAWAVPLASTLMLAHTESFDFTKLWCVWLLFSALSAGALIAGMLGAPRLFEGLRIGSGGSSASEGQLLGVPIIGVLVLAAMALRFYGISFGLPANFHPDEVPKVNAIMRMVQNHNLDPQYFLHPSLLLYSTYFVNSLMHWLGVPLHDWMGIPGDFRTTAFLAGRIVSALAGTASVWLVFAIGSRLYSRSAGLVAAALLAVFPLHVTCSRYLKEDALLTAMILLTVWAVLKAVQEDKRGWLMAAGLLAGMSASTKYSGLLAGAIVASAPWLRSRSWIPERGYFLSTLLALGLVPIGFFLCTPYSLITPEIFVRDFGQESRHMARGHTIPIDAWSQFWMYHFWRSIIPGMSIEATLLALVGVGVLIRRRRIDDLFLVGLVLLFYLPAEWVKAKPEPQPERYIFPCLPFLAIAAGEGLRILAKTRLRLLAPVVLLVAICFPALRTIELAAEVPHDTRDELARWMTDNLPKGSKVYMDWKPYTPRFAHGEFQVTYIPRSTILEKIRVDELRKSGFDYLILSSLFYDRYLTQPLAAPGLEEHIRQVFEKVPVVIQVRSKAGTYGFQNPSLTLFSLKAEDFSRLDDEREQQRLGKISQTSNELRAQFAWRRKD